MITAQETIVDRKNRWGGVLEIPFISNIQRNCLDLGRVEGLVKALEPYDYESVLDVGCGLGESCAVKKGKYIGLDNSFLRVHYASKRFKECSFLMADALELPMKDRSFDLVMMIDTSHHLTDRQFEIVLKELKRVSRKFVVISDPILTKGQNKLSSFFYSLDRGACFRDTNATTHLLRGLSGTQLIDIKQFKTFPSLYSHAAFILKLS